MNTAVAGRRRFFKGESIGDIAFDLGNYTFTIVLTILFLYPLIYVACCSLSSANAIWSGKIVLLPVDFTMEGYQKVFENKDIWMGYGNSLYYMVTGTVLNLFFSLVTAYPLSRKDFMPRNFVMFFYVFCLYFSGGLIPTYLVIKNLGMLDKVWALIVPGAVSTWNIIMVRTFFTNTIPFELHEAAEMDGCSNTWFFIRVVLPLSTPIIAVIALFTAVGFWNSYFAALIYLSDHNKYPLQLILREILVTVTASFSSGGNMDIGNYSDMQEKLQQAATMKYAVIVVACLPMLILYPFVQKYFVRGVMIGALKA